MISKSLILPAGALASVLEHLPARASSRMMTVRSRPTRKPGSGRHGKMLLLASAAFINAVLATTACAQVVYEDSFDNDGLATNAGIGGGLAARTIAIATFNDNGDLVDTLGSNGGNRGVISSINSFNLPNGFILEVHMPGTTTALMQSFGLSTSQFSSDTNAEDWMREQNWAGEGANGRYGIGVETGTFSPNVGELNPRGLKFNNGAKNSTAITNLSTTTSNLLLAGTNTFVLTVTPDDQFSYTYNGGTPVTGEIVAGAGSFDLGQPLYFNVYAQSDLAISYVKITSLPATTGVATLVNFSYNPVDGSASVDIKGAASTNYKLVEADDLDFSSPDQDPIPLTGATVGMLDGNEVTTDGSGNATIQFNLGTSKPATFLRAQSVP